MDTFLGTLFVGLEVLGVCVLFVLLAAAAEEVSSFKLT